MSGSATASNATSTPASPGNRFYRTIWRWHFYAGLWFFRAFGDQARNGGYYVHNVLRDTLCSSSNAYSWR